MPVRAAVLLELRAAQREKSKLYCRVTGREVDTTA